MLQKQTNKKRVHHILKVHPVSSLAPLISALHKFGRNAPIDVKPALGWRRRVMRRGFDIFQNIAVKFLILGQKSPPVPHPGKGFVVTGTSNIPTPGTAR